ncbi:MAG: HD domain-containing protein [Chloroflexota bacterium]
MGLAYRLRQLVHNLSAGPLSVEAEAEVSAVLSPSERALFGRFSPADQWHGVRVLRTLRAAGYNDPDLAAAALLHDIGKTRHALTPLDRSLIVIAQAIMPGRAATWGDGSLASWQRPFVVRAHHPAWGATMVEQAGSCARVVDLVRRHAEPPREDPLLQALQWADDQN